MTKWCSQYALRHAAQLGAERHVAAEVPIDHVCRSRVPAALLTARGAPSMPLSVHPAAPHPQAVLDQVGEGLLADFLRATVYSDRLADALAAGGAPAPARTGAASSAAAGLHAARAARGVASPPAPATESATEAQLAKWRDAAYSAAVMEGSASDAAIVIPQVFLI